MNIKLLVLMSFLLNTMCLISQSGPGGVGSTDGKSSLKLWLDANYSVFQDTSGSSLGINGTKIKLWKDLSGNDNHAKATTDTTCPIFQEKNSALNNQNAIRFYRKDTLNKRNFLLTETFQSTNDITIYCVFHPINKSGGNNVTPFKSKGYSENMWYFGSGLVDAGSNGFTNDVSLAFCDSSIAGGAGDRTDSTDYCLKQKVSVRETYFACLQKEAWSGKLKISNNRSDETQIIAGKQPINAPSKIYIGSNSNVTSPEASPFFDGYIANVLIYNKLLNSAEKIILENYLSSTYNLNLKNNDLYTFDNQTEGDFDFDLIGIGKANDGSFQQVAKGTGFIEISTFNEFSKGSFLFLGHDGKSLTSSNEDLPLGIKNKLSRNWKIALIGNISDNNLVVDSKNLENIDKEKIVLLIDTDNDGQYSDEKIGEGIIVEHKIKDDKIIYQNINFKHGNKFTFAELESNCLNNCNSFFTPNGDGIDDNYYFKETGKLKIINKNGLLVKTVNAPAFWDSSDEKGNLLPAGLYFVISENGHQDVITVIK